MATEAGWAERTTHSLPKIIHIPCHGHTEPPTQTLNYFATLLQPRTPAFLCTENDSAVWRKTIKIFRDSIRFQGGRGACAGSMYQFSIDGATLTCTADVSWESPRQGMYFTGVRSVQQGGDEKKTIGGGVDQQVRSSGADLSADCYKFSSGQ